MKYLMHGGLQRDKFARSTLKAIIIIVLILTPILDFFSHVVTAPPISGDWVIVGEEMYSNTTILLNGSLIVSETGKLTLDNVTLIMNSTYDGENTIQVNNSGVLEMNNSWVRSYDPSFSYQFKVYGNLSFNNSTAEYLYGLPFSTTMVGGIQVYGGNLTLDNSTVTKSQANGIYMLQGRATLSNCNISNNGRMELWLNHSHYVNVTSCTFSDNSTELGYGILIIDSLNFSLRDSHVSGHRGYGVYAYNSPGLKIENTSIAGNDVNGAELLKSDNSSIVNSTFTDNAIEGISVQESKDVLVRSNRFINNDVGIGLGGSSASVVNNTVSLGMGDSYVIMYSDVELRYNSDQNPSPFSLVSFYSNATFRGDSFSGTSIFFNSTAEAVGVTIPSLRSESSDILLVNSTVYSGSPFSIRWESHVTLLNTSVPTWEFFSVDRGRWNSSNPSWIEVKNYLDIRTINETGNPIQGTDILVEDDGMPIYASLGYGGADPVSDVGGESKWIMATDRTYRRDYQIPGHTFRNITYNTTKVSVSKQAHKFNDNPRVAEMAASHGEVFRAIPPTPPTNLTAFLSGSQDENVTVHWNISSDDGGGAKTVENYYIFRGSKYRRNASSYQLIATLTNGTEEFVDTGRGDGDFGTYFYLVCSMDTRNLSSCSSNQAGKFSQNLTASLQLVSIPLVPSNTNITDVFRTIEYDKAWSYLNGEFDPWKSFSKEKSVNDLLDIRGSMGIWINVTSNDSLVVAGSVPLETAIALRPGWNLVGFPSFDETYSVQDLASETGAISVEGYNPLTSPYLLQELGTTESLYAGKGYWIRISVKAIWTPRN